MVTHNSISFLHSGYDLKKASEGSDFVMYSQTNGDKIGPQLALRVSRHGLDTCNECSIF